MSPVQFCEECGGMLRKKVKDGKVFLVCKCGYEEESEEAKKQIEEEKKRLIQEKQAALEKNVVIMSLNDNLSVHLKVKEECPKCKNMEAETWQVQTRSADEPSTTFFKCTKCKFTWREY
ncbi:MAG: transcription factor S [Promethearchaeota archaeon]